MYNNIILIISRCLTFCKASAAFQRGRRAPCRIWTPTGERQWWMSGRRPLRRLGIPRRLQLSSPLVLRPVLPAFPYSARGGGQRPSLDRRSGLPGGRRQHSQKGVHALPPAECSPSLSRALQGDVLAVARIAGIQGAKQTPLLIPLCHQLSLRRVVFGKTRSPPYLVQSVIDEIGCSSNRC